MVEISTYLYKKDDIIIEYFLGSQIATILGYKNTSQVIKNTVSEKNKIKFKDFIGFKDSSINARSILINRDGIYELLVKIKKKLKEDVISILKSINIDIKCYENCEVIDDIEDKYFDKTKIISYSYISNGLYYEYFIGYQIASLIGYKNITQVLKNVSKSNQLVFEEYPGPKYPKIDPKSILITRDGAIEMLIKTRKRITPDVLHTLKEFGIETTNRKCLTKEQQTLSAIANVFKTEKIDDQFAIDSYYLDMYLPDYQIVIECDEIDHSDRKPGDERERMDIVNEILNIDDTHWIRYNPDEYDFDISKVIGRIYRKIDEIKLKKYKEKEKEYESDLKYEKLLKFTKEDLDVEVQTGKYKAPPKEFLIQELKRGNSMLKIGQNLGISSKPVVKWLKEHNLKIDDYNNENMPSKEELLELFETKNQTEVAEHYCKSAHIIRKWLKHYDLDLSELKSKSKLEIDKKLLVELLYKIDDKKEIAEKLKVPELQLIKYMKIHNIHKIPKKEELEKMLKLKSKEDLAEYYNTTRTTLRKWIKSYDLDDIRFTDNTNKKIKIIKVSDNTTIEFDSIKDVCKELKIGKNKVNEFLDTDKEYLGYKFILVK